MRIILRFAVSYCGLRRLWLLEQAKILFAEAEENNLGYKVKNERWKRWRMCSLCEQNYHGFVLCALGWACWKTYLSRPETDFARRAAMTHLGNGLSDAKNDEDALSVLKAELSTERRLGADEDDLLIVQNNLAITYQRLGRFEQAMRMQRESYSGALKIFGEEHRESLISAVNYATSLLALKRFEETKELFLKIKPTAQRVLGQRDKLMMKLRWYYATALYKDDAATLDDLREAVETLEAVAPLWKRIFGDAHPDTPRIQGALKDAREALAARAAA